MKKVLNNLKKTKYIIITIVLIAIIGLVITLNNAGVITKLGNVIRRNIFALDEGNIETTSYYTIGAINGNYLTCQISFENAIGIEKITANGVEIDGKGKTKIGVDRILQEGEELQFNVKIVGKELLAQALAHEIDHLNGILFVDNMIPGTLEYISPEDNK